MKKGGEWKEKVERSKASDDQWEFFAAQLEGERERGGGEAIKRELAHCHC